MRKAGTPGGGGGAGRAARPGRWPPSGRRTGWWCRGGRNRGSVSPAPGRIGRIGAVRSRAWICDFSSTQRTTAFSGGSRYSPRRRGSSRRVRVGGELERLGPPRLRPTCARSWPPWRRRSQLPGQQPRRPVGHTQVRRRAPVIGQRRDHHVDLVDLRRPAAARLVVQRADPARVVAGPPVHHRRTTRSPVRRAISALGRPSRGQQHDPRPQRQPRPHRTRPRSAPPAGTDRPHAAPAAQQPTCLIVPHHPP